MKTAIVEIPENCIGCSFIVGNNLSGTRCFLYRKEIEDINKKQDFCKYQKIEIKFEVIE